MPTKSMRAPTRSKPGGSGMPARVPTEAPRLALPPMAAKAMNSASRDRSVRARTDDAVAVGVLDGEQVHLRRLGRVGGEVALDADGGDEARAALQRIQDVGIGLDLALRHRGLADFLDGAGRQRGLVVAEEG